MLLLRLAPTSGLTPSRYSMYWILRNALVLLLRCSTPACLVGEWNRDECKYPSSYFIQIPNNGDQIGLTIIENTVEKYSVYITHAPLGPRYSLSFIFFSHSERNVLSSLASTSSSAVCRWAMVGIINRYGAEGEA